jgi:hypothetical protein
MKNITKFKLIDTKLMAIPQVVADETLLPGWNAIAHGWGTDAESALDHLLHNLQENDYDVSGLEWQIKNVWNPTEEEGNGKDIYYHLYLQVEA